MVDPVILVAAAVVGVLGLVSLVGGLVALNDVRHMVLQRTRSPSEATEGMAEVVGTVATADGEASLTAPLSGDEAVVYSVSRGEFSRTEKLDPTRDPWKPVAGVTRGVPFELTDDTGSVVVYPGPDGRTTAYPAEMSEVGPRDGGELDVTIETETTVEAGEDPPAAVERVAEAHEELAPPDSRTAHYREWAARTGEELYAIGPARDTDEDGLAIEAGQGTFILSNTPRWKTVGHRLVSALVLGGIGLGLLGGAVWLAVYAPL